MKNTPDYRVLFGLWSAREERPSEPRRVSSQTALWGRAFRNRRVRIATPAGPLDARTGFMRMYPCVMLEIFLIAESMIREALLPDAPLFFFFIRNENPPLTSCIARSRETSAAGVRRRCR